MKQKFTKEDLDGTDTESEFILFVESLKFYESSWSYTRVAYMSFDLSKDKTKVVAVVLNYDLKIHQFRTFKRKMIRYVEFDV